MLLLNLNIAGVGNYYKRESWGLLQRLQYYDTVASLKDLHCYVSHIYFKKNVLKEKGGKQAPHGFNFFMVLQCLTNTWAILAWKQQQEVWPRLSWGTAGGFPTCFATTSPWLFAFLTCFATAAPWPLAWGLFLGLLPSMLVHEFQSVCKGPRTHEMEHRDPRPSQPTANRTKAAHGRLCTDPQLPPALQTAVRGRGDTPWRKRAHAV